MLSFLLHHSNILFHYKYIKKSNTNQPMDIIPPQKNHCPHGRSGSQSKKTIPWATLLTIQSGSLIGSAVFAWLMPHYPHIRYIAPPHFRQICPLSWGIWTPSNTRFLRPTRPTKSAVFSQSLPTDGWTDRQSERSRNSQVTHAYAICATRLMIIAA